MRRGFTIVEFLVVVAIASILFSILVPVTIKTFNKSKQRVRRIYAWRDMQIGTFMDDKAPVSVLMWATTNTQLPMLDLVAPK